MEPTKGKVHYRRIKPHQSQEQFSEFEASMLFCSNCQTAVPVRKKLLLVLPEGDKYDYLCAQCGKPVGSKVTKEEIPIEFITK